MAEGHDTYWSGVRAERLRLADHIGSLDPAAWEAPSWCAGWKVRHVLAHLVYLAEASQASVGVGVVRHWFRPNVTLNAAALTLGEQPVPDLLDRLRAGADGRFHVVGTPRSVVLGEVLVHGADLLRPLGQDTDAPEASIIPVLSTYRTVGWAAFGASGRRGIRLVATDTDWANGRGPEVRGRAIDLLLLMANRRQVLPHLSGPGLEQLA